MFLQFNYEVLIFSSACFFFNAQMSSAVIGCGWLQALRVAGAHPITAKKGAAAPPPLTHPLNIFMYQVGLL